ncbi:hypothetical protein, partial [Mesorhizobium sp. M1378]|uniref:hypothetical protein n=1 Tax=Mesorhizobium sp. M1378 TaxID=2957092 RepID=UPI00333534E5
AVHGQQLLLTRQPEVWKILWKLCHDGKPNSYIKLPSYSRLPDNSLPPSELISIAGVAAMYIAVYLNHVVTSISAGLSRCFMSTTFGKIHDSSPRAFS